MVRVNYICEFSGCEKPYETRAEAEKCESKGLVGPNIQPGLVGIIKITSPQYFISLNQGTPEGHQRSYQFLRIDDSFDELKNNEAWTQKYPDNPRQSNFFIDEYYPSLLDSYVKSGDLYLLDNNQFRKISRLLHHGKSTEDIRKQLISRDITKFHCTNNELFQ